MASYLTFSPRFRLSDLFMVSPDLTPWDGQYDGIPEDYSGRSLVRTPRRAKATFGGFSQGMRLLHGKVLPHTYGVYAVGFLEPRPAMYIGIAAEGGKKPEGILKRLQKHRVKVTGSHTHALANRGGVHHPLQWGSFASERHAAFVSNEKADLLGDAFIMTGSLADGANAKVVLAFYEGVLSGPGVARDCLISALFDGDPGDVLSLNSSKGIGSRPHEPAIILHGRDALHL